MSIAPPCTPPAWIRPGAFAQQTARAVTETDNAACRVADDRPEEVITIDEAPKDQAVQLKLLRQEVEALRRRLQDTPQRIRTLEERLLETKGQLAQAVSANEKLTHTLREKRELIGAYAAEDALVP